MNDNSLPGALASFVKAVFTGSPQSALSARGPGWPKTLPRGGGGASFSKWSMEKALKGGYEASEWVYACVNAVAGPASTVPWRVSEFEGADSKRLFAYELKGIPRTQRKEFFRSMHHKQTRFTNWPGASFERKAPLVPRPDDPLEQLIEKPNPFYTRQAQMERAGQHLLLSGNAMFVTLNGPVLGVGPDVPFEMWPLHPSHVKIDSDGLVPKKYHYTPEGEGVNPRSEGHYDPKSVIHARLPSPEDPLWGMSPIMAAARAIDTDVQTATWNLNAVLNRAIPDMLVSFRGGLKREQYREAKAQLAENRSGPAGARAPWILGNQAEVKQLSLSPVEMDYIRSRGLSRQSICSIFGVFEAVVAVLQGVSTPNLDPIMKHHWIHTVMPFLERWEGEFNLRVAPMFPGDTVVWFDVAGVEALVDSYIERVRAQKILHTQGVPLAECNRRYDLGLDLEGVPLADQPIFPAGVITGQQLLDGENLGNAGGSDSTTVPPEGGEDLDPTKPNEAPPEDVTPDDNGPLPDTLLEDDLYVMESRVLSNGKADPHGGTRRWSEEEVDAYREEHGIDSWIINEERDWWRAVLPEGAFMVTRNKVLLAPPEEGIEVVEDGIRFYHGKATERKREALYARIESWGWKVPE